MNSIIPIKAFKDNYIWTLVNKKYKSAICVDPGDAAPVLKVLNSQNLTLAAILITHHHLDHSGGIQELNKHFSVPVYGPATEYIKGVTVKLNENDIINLPTINAQLIAIEIPAHTAGHIAYLGEGNLFCGDTLFSAGCGRLFEGTAAQMYNSLAKLSKLDGSVHIYCGHEYTEANLQFALTVEPNNPILHERLSYIQSLREQGLPSLPSTIAIEKVTNPFLRCHETSIKQAAEKKAGHSLNSPVEVFTTLREWKDNFS